MLDIAEVKVVENMFDLSNLIIFKCAELLVVDAVVFVLLSLILASKCAAVMRNLNNRFELKTMKDDSAYEADLREIR